MIRRIGWWAILACAGCTARAQQPGASGREAVVSTPQAHKWRATPDAPFRASEPAVGPQIDFKLPSLKVVTMDQGIRHVAAHWTSTLLCHWSVVSSVGEVEAPQLRPGARYGAGSWSGLGTDQNSRTQSLVTALAESRSTIALDGSVHGLTAPEEEFAKVAPLFLGALLRPEFPSGMLDRSKSLSSAHRSANGIDPQELASRAFRCASLGDAHPYCRSVDGSPSEMAALSRDAVVEAHRRAYAPEELTIISTGDCDAVPIESIVHAAMSPRAMLKKPPALTPPPIRPTSSRVSIIDVPGLPRAIVKLGSAAPPGSAADHCPGLVLAQIMGRAGRGRLYRPLAEEINSTWSGWASFDALRHGVVFAWQSDIQNEFLANGITELARQAQRLGTQGVTDEEIQSARERVSALAVLDFGTPKDAAMRIAIHLLAGFPLDEFQDLPTHIRATQPDRVQAFAQKFFDPSVLRVVVVGDLTVLRPQLERLAWGPTDIRDQSGKLVRVETFSTRVAPSRPPSAEPAASGANLSPTR